MADAGFETGVAFEHWLAKAWRGSASVDLILTDPPYGQDFVPAFDRLGALAARVLKPGGSLLAMYGQRSLPQAMAALDCHLHYQWVFAYRLHGYGQAVWAARTTQKYIIA